ncbi:serine/arginine-rich splicing factor 4-like [Symsagittifera roscoffensis]|uniref:serine/arginine-rich splicing factor 4-like n=1 Tax=Symsagittifera roscoffensis TaxID=84072 RepID=UPI00307BC22A
MSQECMGEYTIYSTSFWDMGRHNDDRDRDRDSRRGGSMSRSSRRGRSRSSEHIQVYIGNVASDVTEKDMGRLFKGFDVLDISVKANNFAFVTFGNMKDVREAIRLYNNSNFMGRKISVERARGTDWSKQNSNRDDDFYSRRGSFRDRRSRSRSRNRNRSRSDSRSYEMLVTNLSSRTGKTELFDLANKYGDVTSCKIVKDDRSAIVSFRNEPSLSRALEKMDGKTLNGRQMKCELRQAESSRSKRKNRKGSSSRSKSRSRSDSRSRNGRKENEHDREKEKERSRSRSFSSPKSSHGRKRSSSSGSRK